MGVMGPSVFVISIIAGVAPISLGFNVDPNGTIFSAPGTQFGFQVLQLQRDNQAGWLVVSAPRLRDKPAPAPGPAPPSGNTPPTTPPTLYRCDPLNSSKPCENFTPEGGDVGMAVVADSEGKRFLACNASREEVCSRNRYLKGSCSLYSANSTLLQKPYEETQACAVSLVDLVLLLDGSSSLNEADFNKMITYTREIIVETKGTNIQVAVVQFGTSVQVELTFREFESDSVEDLERKVSRIQHIYGGTSTGLALKLMLNKTFWERKAGARKDAKRTVLLVTDGRATDMTALEELHRTKALEGITRFVIGVGSTFTGLRERHTLDLVASLPLDEHVQVVDNYESLGRVITALKGRIFALEGTSGSDGVSFNLEMSQGGFSAALHKEDVVLGSVGAYDWAGAISTGSLVGGSPLRTTTRLTTSSSASSSPRPPTEQRTDSYLGYAVSIVVIDRHSMLYVAGAPRYDHRGKVIIFSPVNIDGQNVSISLHQEIIGDQIGAYFGGELCVVDEDGDGLSDVLLVASPLYHERGEEGRVHLYRINHTTRMFEPEGVLRGRADQTSGRFGWALAELADVNQDGHRDAAVGAPMEDDGRGALYLFLTTGGRLPLTHTQRVEAASMGGSLRMFGRSVSGRMDLSGDGLTDIAVGSLGNAALLRSRRIVTIQTSISFYPKLIPQSNAICSLSSSSLSDDEEMPRLVTAKVCFTVNATDGRVAPIVYLRHSLLLDEQRSKLKKRNARATLTDSEDTAETFEPVSSVACYSHNLTIQACVEDPFVPVSVAANVSLLETEPDANGNRGAVLTPGQPRGASALLGFRMSCGDDETCVPNLQLTASPCEPSVTEVVLGRDEFVFLCLRVSNSAEDTTDVRVRVSLSPSLLFNTVNNVSHGSHVQCQKTLRAEGAWHEEVGGDNKEGEWREEEPLICYVTPTVLKANGTVSFTLQLQLVKQTQPPSHVIVRATARGTNESSVTLWDNDAEVVLPVRQSARVIISSKSDHLLYPFGYSQKEVPLEFQVENLLESRVNVTVCVSVPSRDHGSLRLYEDKKPEGCSLSPPHRASPPGLHGGAVDCVSAQCMCCAVSLGGSLREDLSLAGIVSFAFGDQFKVSRAFTVQATVHINQTRYWDVDNTLQHNASLTIDVQVDYMIPIIVISSLVGLILMVILTIVLAKCGFFSRKSPTGGADTSSRDMEQRDKLQEVEHEVEDEVEHEVEVKVEDEVEDEVEHEVEVEVEHEVEHEVEDEVELGSTKSILQTNV